MEAASFAILLFRPTLSIQAENLFLRRQLGLFKKRSIKSRRVDAAARISLAIQATLFSWRNALYEVQPRRSSDGSVQAGACCCLMATKTLKVGATFIFAEYSRETATAYPKTG